MAEMKYSRNSQFSNSNRASCCLAAPIDARDSLLLMVVTGGLLETKRGLGTRTLNNKQLITCVSVLDPELYFIVTIDCHCRFISIKFCYITREPEDFKLSLDVRHSSQN